MSQKSLGNHLLRSWRKTTGLTQTEAAVRLGLNMTKVSKLENHGRPGLEAALRIEQVTNGAVPAASWMLPPPSDVETEAKAS